MYLFFFLVTLNAALVLGEPVPTIVNRCDQGYPNAKLSPDYWMSIAHALHSMDLKSLRKFIPQAEQDSNGIPTTNIHSKLKSKVSKARC